MEQNIDVIYRKRLVLIKQVYNHALEQSHSKHYFSNRFISVIGFDWANEALLKAILSSTAPSESPKNNFHKLIDQCDNALKNSKLGELPGKNGIKSVRKIRNAAQHEGRRPGLAEINDCRTHTSDFLTYSMPVVWGINFDELYMSDAIVNTKVREFMKKSEISMDKEDLQDTVNNASCAFELSLKLSTKPLLRGTFRSPNFPQKHRLRQAIDDPCHSLRNATMESFRNTWKEIERINKINLDITLILALGIDLTRFIKYKNLAPKIFVMQDGTHKIYGNGVNYSREEVMAVYNFCIDSVLQIENLVEDLEFPFGLDPWNFSKFI